MRCFSLFAWLFSSKKRVAADPARPAAGAIELGPMDEGEQPDSVDHLTLGLNLEGIKEACELVGFPYSCYKGGWSPDAWDNTYKRADHPEMNWLEDAYPDSNVGGIFSASLGYDFCCAIKAWLRANGCENKSICQVLLERGSKNVRRANVFYSHIQGVRLYETIKRMREAIEASKDQLPQATEAAKALVAEQRARLAELNALIKSAWLRSTKRKLEKERKELKNKLEWADESHLFFWLDYTTLKQCQNDFDLPRIRWVIKEIGLTLAELDFDLQAYLTRSFCILELFATVEGGAKLLVQMHVVRAFDVAAELAARPVDARAAKTRRDADKAKIDGFVESMEGGFERLNTTITEAIKEAAAVIAKQFVASEIELENKGLTDHDATVVAEILKSNTSVTYVWLNGNEEIGDEGAKALAEALKVNATVEWLNLGSCGIGDDGAAAIAEALRSNTSLEELWLTRNGFGEQGKQLLRDAVAGREGFDLRV